MDNPSIDMNTLLQVIGELEMIRRIQGAEIEGLRQEIAKLEQDNASDPISKQGPVIVNKEGIAHFSE